MGKPKGRNERERVSHSREDPSSIHEKCLFPRFKNAYNIATGSETRTFFLSLRLSNMALQQTLLGN